MNTHMPRSLRQAKKHKRKCQHPPTQKKKRRPARKSGHRYYRLLLFDRGKKQWGEKKVFVVSQTTQMALETKLLKGFCDGKKSQCLISLPAHKFFCDNTARVPAEWASCHTQQRE